MKLVAKTYEQKTKFDLDEIFVSFIKCNAMRSIMALVVHKKCELLYLDAKMMFLNGDMKEDVFTISTKGFQFKGNNRRCASFIKPCIEYDTHQGPNMRK